MVTVRLVEANSIADRCGPCSRVKSGAEGPLGSVTSHRWADRRAHAFGSCEDGVWPRTVEPKTRMKELARLKCVLPFMTSSFRRCSVASFSRNVDSVRCHKLRVRNFRPKFDTLQSGLLFGFTEKRQQVLMSEPARQILEEWGEGNGVAEAQEIGFSSGLAGYLRKIVLTPVESPEGMPIVAHTSRVDGVNNDARTLSLLNRRIHVRIGRAHTSESVYAIRDYKNFSANFAFGPALNQVANR